MKLVIASTMKPMIEGFVIEQYNAIRSWQFLRLKPEIIIYGDDKGVAEFCHKYKIRHIPEVRKNKKNVPLVTDIIKQTYNLCQDGDYVAYINADILLMDDFCDTLEAFDQKYHNVQSCLLTAIRWDTFKFHKIKFHKGGREEKEGKTEEEIKALWRKDVRDTFIGRPCTADGIDLFVHKRGNYQAMPDFAVARMLFDSWMLDYAIRNFDIVADMTETVRIWHHLGDWYQNNKVVARDWSRYMAVMDRESVEENKKTAGTIVYNLITHCPFISTFYQDSQETPQEMSQKTPKESIKIKFVDRFHTQRQELLKLICNKEKFKKSLKGIGQTEGPGILKDWLLVLPIRLLKEVSKEFE